MAKEQIHLGIEYPEECPDILLDNLMKEIRSSDLNIKYLKQPSIRTFASLEWVIPTAVTAYILKPYFDGYLKEMGKEHYLILKDWLKKFVEKCRLIKVTTLTSSQSPQKISNQSTQSKAISLMIQTKNDKVIKLLLDEELSKEDWENAIDLLLDYVIENYENKPNGILKEKIENLAQNFRQNIYVIIDKETKILSFYDDKDLVELHKQQSNIKKE